MRKNAFTLSEVLIVVVILGVVASIIVPILIKQHQRRITVTKVKKFYSALSDAYGQFLIQNHEIPIYPYTAEGTKQAFDEIIRPYFQISYDAGFSTDKKKNIMSTQNFILLNGTKYGYSYYTQDVYYAAQLKSGETIILRSNNHPGDKALVVELDIDGVKGENTVGKDIFFFYLKERDVYFDSSIIDMKKVVEEKCINQNSTGWGCASWIIKNSNMNYLDCPGKADWNTGKCKK